MRAIKLQVDPTDLLLLATGKNKKLMYSTKTYIIEVVASKPTNESQKAALRAAKIVFDLVRGVTTK